MATPTQQRALSKEVTQLYDTMFQSELHEEMFGHSGFSNWGYWLAETRTAVRACEQLVDKLIAPIPHRGSVLDVGCGSGGTTARLAGMFAEVTAINVSAYQVARTQERAPTCRALQMDASELSFPDASFDAVVSVEAVCHFRSKARFFAHAHRVLKPGGWLALSDIIFAAPRSSYSLRMVPNLPETIFPHANEWNLLAYRDFLEVLGFEVTFTSAYQQTWQRFFAFYKAFLDEKARANPAGSALYQGMLSDYQTVDRSICDYVLIAARKL